MLIAARLSSQRAIDIRKGLEILAVEADPIMAETSAHHSCGAVKWISRSAMRCIIVGFYRREM